MTSRDKTPVIFEQRCDRGHFHIYVVPRYVAQYLMTRYPGCSVVKIDKELMSEAAALIEAEENKR